MEPSQAGTKRSPIYSLWSLESRIALPWLIHKGVLFRDVVIGDEMVKDVVRLNEFSKAANLVYAHRILIFVDVLGQQRLRTRYRQRHIPVRPKPRQGITNIKLLVGMVRRKIRGFAEKCRKRKNKDFARGELIQH